MKDKTVSLWWSKRWELTYSFRGDENKHRRVHDSCRGARVNGMLSEENI